MRLRSQARSHSRGCQCRLGSLPRCAHGRSEDPILEKQLAHPHRRRPRPANLCVPLVLRHRKWSQSSQSSCVHALFDCRTVPVQYCAVPVPPVSVDRCRIVLLFEVDARAPWKFNGVSKCLSSPVVHVRLCTVLRCWHLLGSGSFDGSLPDRGSVITRCAVRIGR